jgi:hypothetical protein
MTAHSRVRSHPGYFVQKLERLGDVAAEGERGEEDVALRAFIFTERTTASRSRPRSQE